MARRSRVGARGRRARGTARGKGVALSRRSSGSRSRKAKTVTSSMREALEKAGPKPGDSADQDPKRKYAERLSNALADVLARDLKRRFPKLLAGIKSGETRAGSQSGAKRLDVNYSTELHGLGLGVSIKTISHRDKKSGRYTHNMKRVDEEFLAEAMDYHVRQPYAVLVGLHFMPVGACDDAKAKSTASSFGSWVKKLFGRTGRRGRSGPKDNAELFERMFIGLFEPDGPNRGDVRFFDVRAAPPKQGRPAEGSLLNWDDLLDQVGQVYTERNAAFRWAGEKDVDLSEEDEPEESDDE